MKKRIILALLVLLGTVLILLYTNFGFNFFKKEDKQNEETIIQFIENYRNFKTDDEIKDFCSNTYGEFIYYAPTNNTYPCIGYKEASEKDYLGTYSSYFKYQHQVVDISKTEREFVSSIGKKTYIEYVVISKYKVTETSSYSSFTGKFYFVEHDGKTIYSYEHLPIRWSIFTK